MHTYNTWPFIHGFGQLDTSPIGTGVNSCTNKQAIGLRLQQPKLTSRLAYLCEILLLLLILLHELLVESLKLDKLLRKGWF